MVSDFFNEARMDLAFLGWSSFFEDAFSAFDDHRLRPARVAIQHRNYYVLYSEVGELRGQITGKMEYFASGPSDLPSVGDWVVVEARPQERSATILAVLPRRTKFSRKIAGTQPQEQIIASNIDLVFVVSGLDADFNLRRLERYLVLAAESGADPILILNKADLCEDQARVRKSVEKIAESVPICFTSALNDEGLRTVLSFLAPGITGALLGSSGVGKTTMINRILGSEERKTQPVREQDHRGRHTTSYRELIPLPSGGLLIDSPGLRELQLWGGDSGVRDIFQDIVDLASSCRFRDCTHEVEPGCAVREAIETGNLDDTRLNSYKKLLRELAFQSRRHDAAEQRREKERVKKMMAPYRRGPKKGNP